MDRDFFRCCQCGSKEKTLNVHHQYYIKGRKPWEYNFDLIHIASMIAYKKQKILKEYPDSGHDVMKYRFYNVEFDSDDDISDYSYNFENQYKDKYKNG